MIPRLWTSVFVLIFCASIALGQTTDSSSATATLDNPSTQPAAVESAAVKAPAGEEETAATPAAEKTAEEPAGKEEPQAAADDVGQIRREAVTELLAGHFDKGMAALKRVLTLSPKDGLSVQADGWVGEYLNRQSAATKQQQQEYAAAVEKAKRLLELAQAAGSENDLSDETLRKLRTELKPVRMTISAALTAPETEENYVKAVWYTERLDKDWTTVREHLTKMRETLGESSGVRAEAIRKAIGGAEEALDAYRKAAEGQDWSTAVAGGQSYAAIEDRSDELIEAVAYDLADSISSNLWQQVLDRACVAKYILPDASTLLHEPWLEPVTEGAEAQARADAEAGKWYRAMMLYSGLANLYEETGRYKDDLSNATRHARVLSLYAPEAAAAASAAEAEDELAIEEKAPLDREPQWKETIHGVDAVTVRKALGLIEQYYVENVDYRRVLHGAIQAVRILVETDEAAKTFEGLADAEAKAKFLGHLDKLEDSAKSQATVDHNEVARQLYSVLIANNRTVKIPQEVIDVEFTDGMTDQLDRYTQVIWPEKMDEFRKQTMGSFEGIGVQIQMENGLLKVVSPLEDTPAFKAGLQAGDYIIRIDGKDAKNIDINEAVRQITGPEGTKVTLTISRPGQANFDKAIARAQIQVQTVKGWKRANGSGWDWMIDPDSKIGYIRITNFNEDTAEHLRKALKDLNGQDCRGLILDLRDNPGGLLNIAVDVAEEFLRGGAIISTRGRDGQPHPPVEASRRGLYQTGPLVLLVNSYSASASEIVSGALKDHGRALVVGRRTFGKGVVQNLVRIDESGVRLNPAVLKVTAARYYLPSGRCLHRTDGASEWGVQPDIDVAMTPRQTRKWLNSRRQTEIIRDRSTGVLDREMTRQLGADLQLDAALLICRLQALQGDLNLKLAAADEPRPAAKDKPTEAVAK